MSKPTIAAERNLLGAAMHYPYILDEHGASLNDADWYRPQHGALWRRLTALRADPQHARTEPGAWTALVLHEAYTWGQEVDGAAYVAAMVAAAPDVDSAAYFMRVIQSSSLGRLVRDVASAAMHQIDEGRPAAEVLAGFESAIATLAARASVQASPWVAIGDVAAEVYDETQEAARNPESRIKRVVPTPWPTINLRTRGGLRRGEMAILAGRPGTGKTAAAMQMAEYAALYGGVGVFSMEMTRHALTTRELAREGRVDLTAITSGRLSREQWAGMVAGVEVLHSRPIWIDDTPALHIAQMRARAKRLAERAKREGAELRTLVVDYVQLATATVGKGESGQEVLSRISQGLVALAKELDVAVLALAQMNRSVEGRTGERPKNSDLRGSGQLEQDAAVIMFTFRDPDSEIDDARELVLTKARHGETGDVPMRWDGSVQTLYEVEPHHEAPPRVREVDRWQGGE